MSRGTFIYVVMLAVFGAGLWAIISFGSSLLHAPEDLAGRWRLVDPKSPGDASPQPLVIEQSGRYFKIQLAGHAYDLRLVEESTYSDRTSERRKMRLVNGNITMTFDGKRGGDVFDVSSEGAVTGTWLAHRVSRAYNAKRTHEKSPVVASGSR